MQIQTLLESRSTKPEVVENWSPRSAMLVFRPDTASPDFVGLLDTLAGILCTRGEMETNS